MQGRSIEILRELVHHESNSVSLREYLGEAVNKLGGFQRGQGKFAGFIAPRSAKPNKSSKHCSPPTPTIHWPKRTSPSPTTASPTVWCDPASRRPRLKYSMKRWPLFRSLSPDTASNRYVRSGFASANYLMGNVYAALAASRQLSRTRASAEWREARSWYRE